MNNPIKAQIISFYKVPLSCHAATDIGCGSRAKPALLEIEKDSSVAEAWINRAGTVLAVAWKENDMTKKVAKLTFDKHNIHFQVLNKQESLEHLINFRQIGKWYRGSDVDQLSKEEASRISETATELFFKKNEINQGEQGKIKKAIKSYFEAELVKIRTSDELGIDCQTTFPLAIVEIYAEHIGKERADRLIQKYGMPFGINNTMDCCG